MFVNADLNKSSPLKPLCQMNRNLVGSIYGMSSLKIAYFLLIRYHTWPPQTILPRMLPTKFRFIWQSGFREEDFLEINQSETRMTCGGHVC
jgi:hypothetical protein